MLLFRNDVALFLLFIFCVGSPLLSANDTDNLGPARSIYGSDSRKSITEMGPIYQMLAKSVAVQVDRSHFENGGMRFFPLDIQGRFAHWPSASSCTGFLVSSDKLLTAGHCIKSDADCRNKDWVFDYLYSTTFPYGNRDTIPVLEKNHYSCKKILSQENEDGYDYALIQLDRKVFKRSPLLLSYRPYAKRLKKGTPLFVIGSPMGLPLIYATGEVVKDVFVDRVHEDYRLLASLDTFQGNSGSPVFSASGMVEGILVSGLVDYDSHGVALVYDKAKAGEHIFPLSQVEKLSYYIKESSQEKTKNLFELLSQSEDDLIDYLTTVHLVNVEVKNKKGWTPLLVAADSGYDRAVSLLISKGANKEAKTSIEESTALILAASKGHENVVKVLLKAHVYVNHQTKNKNTALIKAAQKGYSEIVRLLIDAHANTSLKNENNRDALWYATEYGYHTIEKSIKEKDGR